MLTNRTLAQINNRPRKVNRLPLLVAGGGTLVVAALLYAFAILPPLAILGVLGGGVLLTLLLNATRKSKTSIRLSYEGNLEAGVASRFSEAQETLESLASSEGIGACPFRRNRRKRARWPPCLGGSRRGSGCSPRLASRPTCRSGA